MRRYVGRFAPSPTGPLHLGSLVSALAGWLRARQADGAWHLRIEDVDPPRMALGSVAAILRSLEAHGLHWDGPVIYQSQRSAAYAAALTKLQESLYPCACTRTELREDSRAAADTLRPLRYPGTCRNGIAPKHANRPQAMRLRTPDIHIEINDLWQGTRHWHLPGTRGDVVLRRADGVYTYPLAVVVDDAEQGITEVVRGMDLLDETPAQLGIQRLLNLPQPAYAHHPLVMQQGQKLSKQNLAAPLNDQHARSNLLQALQALGTQPPAAGSTSELLDWARNHWDPQQLQQKTEYWLNDNDT